MGSPSRNVQDHPPRLSEDRLNLPQPHSPSLPTHCTAPGNRECALRDWQANRPHVPVRHRRSLVTQQVSQHVRADTRRRRIRHDSPPQVVQPNVRQSRQPRRRREVCAGGPIRQRPARIDREHVVIPIHPEPGAHGRKRRVRKVVMHPPPGLRLRQRHAPILEVDMLPANRAHFRYSQSSQRRNPDRGNARGVPLVEPVESDRQRCLLAGVEHTVSCLLPRPPDTPHRVRVLRSPFPRLEEVEEPRDKRQHAVTRRVGRRLTALSTLRRVTLSTRRLPRAGRT